jgi:hypothetical protein
MLDPVSAFWVAIATIILSVFVLIGASLSFGRILADLEYQDTAGINGVRHIQSHVSLRTQGKRIMLGLFGLSLGIMALTTLDIAWQYSVSGLLLLVILIIFGTSSILDWFSERDSVRILFHEREAQLTGTREPRGTSGEQGPAEPAEPAEPPGVVGPAGESA